MIRKIRKAAVIGSGIMGGGIAALLAGAGVKTLLLDIVPFDLKDEEKDNTLARNRIVKAGLDAALTSKPSLFMSWDDAALIETGNLEDDFDKLAQCDWIIEVVVENLKIKNDLFKRIETIRKSNSIISSNTSGIPLKDMSEGLGQDFKQHFLGTHFFNPVRYMHLLELIPGEETLPEVMEFVAEFGEINLGKGIVRAKDTPNFIGNRIGIQGICKTMQLMVEEEISIPGIDALFGPAMGKPKTAVFKTSDIVGLDTMEHVAANTYETCTEDEERESFLLPQFIRDMVKNNLLGSKTKAGFYKTDLTPEWKKIRKVINYKTGEYEELQRPSFPCLDEAKKKDSLAEKMICMVYGEDKGSEFVWKSVSNGLIYAANRIPEISDTVVEIDNAMKWGYNFEAGPFETWDAIGLKRSVKRMEDESLKVPEKIKAMVSAGNDCFYKTENGESLFYDFSTQTYKPVHVSSNMISLAALKRNNKTVKSCESASLVDLGDGVFCCEFHTKMNALNAEMADFMGESFDYVDAEGTGLVIGNQAGGMPGAFSAGADISFLLNKIKEKKFSEISEFLARGQEGMQRARYSSFPIVAAPYGMTLGGGCEVCIGAADRIVAHSELYMGLVEIGVGLIPAGCGCLNLWKKFISSVPDAVKDFDLGKLFLPVFQNIAMAQVSTSAAQARANGFLGSRDRIVFNRDNLIGEAKKEVLAMANAGYAPPAKKKIKVLGESAPAMVMAEMANMRAAKFISKYDAFIAEKIAFVISGGDTAPGSEIDEEVILRLERDAFVELCQEEKTVARIEHMLKTGKPLRN